MKRSDMRKLTVVKFGSELVTKEDGVHLANLEMYTRLLNKEFGNEGLVVITSGAVKAGRIKVERAGGDASLFSEPTLSQLGGNVVMGGWENAFECEDRLAGGLLVTHNELDDSKEGPLFEEALQFALDKKVVSIVNANDALSRTELMALASASDNDGLAVHIATALKADKLCIYTANGGIADDNGNLIDIVNNSNVKEVYEMLKSRTINDRELGDGRGGILEKFRAAVRAAEAGIESSIEMISTDAKKRKTTQFVLG
jgi:glutamate 5-kinase